MRDATSNARSDFTTSEASDAPEGDVALMGRGPLIEIFKFPMTPPFRRDKTDAVPPLLSRIDQNNSKSYAIINAYESGIDSP